jgi:hypothetical protein
MAAIGSPELPSMLVGRGPGVGLWVNNGCTDGSTNYTDFHEWFLLKIVALLLLVTNPRDYIPNHLRQW